MEKQLYVAFYFHKKKVRSLRTLKERLADDVIKFFSRGSYSHCEIVYQLEDGLLDPKTNTQMYRCYTSSIRDGGVRVKDMGLPKHEWVLIPIEKFKGHQNQNMNIETLEQFYQEHDRKKYDLLGACGIVLGIKDKDNKMFCSEFCAAYMGYSEPWRFTPTHLETFSR